MPATATLSQSTAAQGATIGGAFAGFTPAAAYLTATGVIDINATALLNFDQQTGQWVGDIPAAQALRAYAVVLTDNGANTAVAAGALDVTLASATWYYAAQTAVDDAISAAGLRIMSNMENTDLLANTARILRAGLNCDAAMDARFRSWGFATPLSLSDATDASILEQISVALVIAQLCRWRVLQVTTEMGSYSTISKMSSNFADWADNQITEIGLGRIKLRAARKGFAPADNAGAVTVTGLPLYPQTPPGFGGPVSVLPLPPWNG